MDTRMKKFLNSKYANKSYPAKSGQPWTDEEEATLLEELKAQIDMDRIAAAHKRTVGGITARCKEIAYKMYTKHVPLDEIAALTKLHPECVQQVIDKKQESKPDKSEDKSLEQDIHAMKQDIQELKQMMQDIMSFLMK